MKELQILKYCNCKKRTNALKTLPNINNHFTPSSCLWSNQKQITKAIVNVIDSSNTTIDFAEITLSIDVSAASTIGKFEASQSTDFEGKVYFYINKSDWPKNTDELAAVIDVQLLKQDETDSASTQKVVTIHLEKQNEFEVLLAL